MPDYSKTYLKLLGRADQNRITDASGNVFELDPENETIKYISGPDINTSVGDVIDTTNTGYEQTLINLLADTEPLKVDQKDYDYLFEGPSVDQLKTADEKKAAQKQRGYYAAASALASGAPSVGTLLSGTEKFKSEVEKQAEETVDAGVQEMTGAEEAQLKQMTNPRGGLRENRMRGEGLLATGLGNVLTSVADATQYKVAQAKATVEALQQQGMFIAQEKGKAIEQSLAEIKDAMMTDYAMARERRAAAQTLGDSLGKAIAFYGGHQIPQVASQYDMAYKTLGQKYGREPTSAEINAFITAMSIG